MDFGSLSGLVNATEQCIFDSGELTAAQTSITIDSTTTINNIAISGDTDEEYTIYARIVNGYNGSATYYVRPNNVSTAANYGRQMLRGENTLADASRGTDTGLYLGDMSTIAYLMQSEMTIHAKSGYVRTAINRNINNITGTTVGDIRLWGLSWNNTADNITRMDVISSVASGIGIGSRIILMKKVVATTGMRTGVINCGQPLVNATTNRSCTLKGQWQTIYKNTLASAATSVTISGLDGNTDVMYRLVTRIKNGYNGATTIFTQLNTDSANNYGRQYLDATNTDVAAARTANTAGITTNYMAAQNNLSMADILIHAKSGYVRTCIAENTYSISTTTITQLQLAGWSWNNTADNITNIKVTVGGVNELMEIGSEIELLRLIP